MIVPKTKDGRVVFMLPWLDATIAGTTGTLPMPVQILSWQTCCMESDIISVSTVALECCAMGREKCGSNCVMMVQL